MYIYICTVSFEFHRVQYFVYIQYYRIEYIIYVIYMHTVSYLRFFRFLSFFFLCKDQCLPTLTGLQRMAFVAECDSSDPLPPAKRLSLSRPSSVHESGTRLITVLYQPNGNTSRADDQTSLGAPLSVVFQPFSIGPDLSKIFLPDEFVHKFVRIADIAYVDLVLSTGLDVLNPIQSVSFLAGPETWFTSASLFYLIHYIIDSISRGGAGALQRLLLQRIRCVPVFPVEELFRCLQCIALNMMQLNELHIDISVGLRQDNSDAVLTMFSSALVSGVPERKAQPSLQFQKLTQFSFGSANATGRIDYGPCTSVVAEKLSSMLPSGLKELHLYEPIFLAADIPALSSLLDGLKELTSLSCKLADLKTANAERLTTSLTTLSKLRSLALEYVCSTARKQSMPWVGGIQTLEKFTLRVVGNFCWGDFWKVVHDVVLRCRSLRELHVDEKFIRLEHADQVSHCVVTFEEMERAMADASEVLEVLVWRVGGRLGRKHEEPRDPRLLPLHNYMLNRLDARIEYYPHVFRSLKLGNLVRLEIKEQRIGNWLHSNGQPSFRCLRSLKSLSLVNCQGCADSLLQGISELPLSALESFKILDFVHISEPSVLDESVATSTPATRCSSLFHWLSHMKNLVVLHLSGGVGYSDLAYACKEMCVEDGRQGKVR
jgi:hypothetical protein